MKASFLYTPALTLDSLTARRYELEADVVVVDLEDSVHFKAKAEARKKVATFDFSPMVELGIRLGLRVNTVGCFEGVRDLAMFEELSRRPDCPFDYVFLPKIGDPGEVGVYRTLFGTLRRPPRLVSFIETLEAVENADAIAARSDAICMGQADLTAQMYSPNPAYLDYARARICAAAARHYRQAVDTNSFEIHDMARFERECVAAKECGFTGKAAIHPNQLEAINRIFSVSAEALAGYRRTIDEYVNSDIGFALKDGQVVAPPFVAKARMMLEAFDTWSAE